MLSPEHIQVACPPLIVVALMVAATVASAASQAAAARQQQAQYKGQKEAAQAQRAFQTAQAHQQADQQRQKAASQEEGLRIRAEQERGALQAQGLQGKSAQALAREIYGSAARDIARVGLNLDIARAAAEDDIHAANLSYAGKLASLDKPSTAGAGLAIGATLASGASETYDAYKTEKLKIQN